MISLIQDVTDPEAARLAHAACEQLVKSGQLPKSRDEVVVAVNLWSSWVQVVPASVAYAAITACSQFLAGAPPTEQEFKADLSSVQSSDFLVVVFTRVGITKFAMSRTPVIMSKGGQA